MAMPQNMPNTMQQLGELVDEMWFLAGDKSTDLNWYTKRMLLSGVYTSTEMFMTQDQSEGYKATFEFLDRRLKGKGS
jgi:ubiquinone biosynthesis protein COQ9